MADEIVKEEQQLIALLLKNKDLVEDYKDSPLTTDHFDATNRVIIHAINDAYEKDVQLTRKSFLEFIGQIVSKKAELARLEIAFNQISYMTVDRNDYPMFKERILNAYLLRKAGQNVRDFTKNREERGTAYAVQQLAATMTDLATNARQGTNKIVYEDLSSYGKEYVAEVEGVIAGTILPPKKVSFGIPELDYTSGVGMAPGTMTLFCGDVGGFKSTMMMNVGLHAWWKENYNVLYVPLEMPRKMCYQKILSRQTHIPFDFLSEPKTLTAEHMGRLKKYALEDAPSHGSKIYLMDSYEQRTSVNLIRRMIERNLEIFKPDVVIIDYIANLTPDKKSDRPDIEIGEMLKDLRYMGRPGVVHDSGFGIVSGAQIGREGLKRVRRGGNDKAMFYSEDIRGSHDYSADADTIYAQFRDPQQPDERLQVFVVKARYGKKSFADGQTKAMLEIKPEISLIRSASDYYDGADKNDVMKKAALDEGDLDFATPVAKKTESSASMDDFDIFDDAKLTKEPAKASSSLLDADDIFSNV